MLIPLNIDIDTAIMSWLMTLVSLESPRLVQSI